MNPGDMPAVKTVTVSTSLTIHATFESFGGWATFVIDDAQGTLSITSDWGDWAYRWGRGSHLGSSPELSEALAGGIGRDYDYCARKLTAGSATVFDEDATRKAMRKHVLDERRRGAIDRHHARAAWEESGGEFSNEDAFFHLLERSPDLSEALGDEPWFFVRHADSPRFLTLREFLLPFLHRTLVARREVAA
jgi:hypothetical protein